MANSGRREGGREGRVEAAAWRGALQQQGVIADRRPPAPVGRGGRKERGIFVCVQRRGERGRPRREVEGQGRGGGGLPEGAATHLLPC